MSYSQNSMAPYEPESRRKNLVPLLALAALLLLLAVIVAYFTVHIWQEGDCGQPETCTICGKESARVRAHRWKETAKCPVNVLSAAKQTA